MQTTPFTEKNRIELALALADRESAGSYLGYLDHLVVDSRPEPARFSKVARPWQWEWARQTARVLEHYAGIRTLSPQALGPRLFWRTLARGHDKTTGLARKVNWLLRYARRPLVIHAAAADKDQAALLLDAMKREAELNPWLGSGLAFTKDGAKGTQGSELTILTSDAPTAAGGRPDVVIMDEITHWKNDKLWDMLWTGVPKREAALFVITNAGTLNSWQWRIKQGAKSSSLWSVYEAPGRLDTWMSETEILANKKLCTPGEAKRLWDNLWIDPAEESGYITRDEITACEDPARTKILSGLKGIEYWAGIDYGPKRDRTALSITHQEQDGLAVLDSLDVWQGAPGSPIQLALVREWMDEKRAAFPDLNFVVDPYQMENIVQDYERRCRIERFEARGGKSNYEMAELMRSLIVNKRLALYPEAGCLLLPDGRTECLKDELASLIIKRMVYGYRFDHELTLHDDRAVALGMPLVMMLGKMLPVPFKKPPLVEQKHVELPEVGFRKKINPVIITAEARGLYGMKNIDDRMKR